ncbi:hypothetical protein ACHHYP_04319 [Achlya hypogyna]|uniref:Disease resistance R13L4/SHOC-2-like LRR domain-containing protein n=1 Tax=Achlya hypogyna TaxID=1202772 RepID=A0A1V9Z1G2_ACHHY|nr:hypothetical protein ACHHYP_04319 [Achlya hypogyna]
MGGGASKPAKAEVQPLGTAVSAKKPSIKVTEIDKSSTSGTPSTPKPIKDLKLYLTMYKDDELELSHASGSEFTGTLTKNKLAVLKIIPPEVFLLCHLKELNVSANDLRTLDPAIVNLEQLSKLDISQNHIVALPEELCQLKNLTSLIVSENELTALPTAMGDLRALTQLIAFKNSITTLPNSIGGCTELEEINFFNNKLTELGPGFPNLVGLVEMNIAGNGLMQMDPIPNLTRLKRCAAYLNRLRSFPDLNHCTELTQVQLYRNQLKELPNMANLPNLTELDANTNLLRQIPDSLCTNLSLRMLNLRKNRLVALPPSIGQLTGLEILNVGGNAISSPLPVEMKGLQGLLSLLLDESNLTVLPVELTDIKTLVRVDVGKRIDTSDATTTTVMKRLEEICVGNNGWLKQT